MDRKCTQERKKPKKKKNRRTKNKKDTSGRDTGAAPRAARQRQTQSSRHCRQRSHKSWKMLCNAPSRSESSHAACRRLPLATCRCQTTEPQKPITSNVERCRPSRLSVQPDPVPRRLSVPPAPCPPPTTRPAGNGANASVLFYFCIFFGVFQLLRRCLYIFQVVCV